MNGNGFYDNQDIGTSGITVSIYEDINLDGQVDAGDALSSSQVTDVNGGYTFTPSLSGASMQVSVRVATGSDDAEESLSSGAVGLSSSDLELINDSGTGANDQIVGMRFQSLNIPQGATIANAYLEFEVDEATSGATSLTFHGEAVNDAVTFKDRPMATIATKSAA